MNKYRMLTRVLASAALLVSFTARAEQYVVRGGHRITAFSPMANYLPLTGARVIELTAAQAAQLAQQGYAVEVNQRVQLFVESTSPATPNWHREAIHTTEANALQNGKGENVTVCVVDTGVDQTLADLKDAVTGGINLVQGMDANDLSDKVHHGTAVAGLIAGRGVHGPMGIAPEAHVYAVKVFADDGSATTANVAEGILNCIGRAQVINLSLGMFQDSPLIQSAVDSAIAAGLSVVAAAGNETNDVGFPARYTPVIAVGAVDEHLAISAFSGRGPALDFVAPGENLTVLTPGGSLQAMSGTSFSSAIASGVEAIRISRNRAHLQAIDLGKSAQEQGRGLLDALMTAQ